MCLGGGCKCKQPIVLKVKLPKGYPGYSLRAFILQYTGIDTVELCQRKQPSTMEGNKLAI